MEFLEALDQGLPPWIEAARAPWLTSFMKAITHCGDRTFLAVVVLLATGLFVALDRYRAAGLVLAAALLSIFVSDAVKAGVQRPRPDVRAPLIGPAGGWSFPSGHAFSSAAVYGTLAFLAMLHVPYRRLRFLAAATGLLLVFLVGFSRVYLGVHYVTDVLAGWAGGLGLAIMAGGLDRRFEEIEEKDRARS
jgi:undecaprenyl-diphosphatase